MPNMWMEILKLLATFGFGGVGGALLNEWMRRRQNRVQKIRLIERVNRRVSPMMEGFTLARLDRSSGEMRMEQITNVHEYQFTLRNTSDVHLRDVEVQFEFSTKDVQGWVERPALSKTLPIPVEPMIAPPWEAGYRWKVPQLPATDSIDFTFRAVDPPSEKYEVALYNSDRIVIDRSIDRSRSEPEPTSTHKLLRLYMMMSVIAAGLLIGPALYEIFSQRERRTVGYLEHPTCQGFVISEAKPANAGFFSNWFGPWQISYRVVNTGSCTIDAAALSNRSTLVQPQRNIVFTRETEMRPVEVMHHVNVMSDDKSSEVHIRVLMP